MKYEVVLNKTEAITLVVDAESPCEAIQQALLEHPGHTVNRVEECREGGATVESVGFCSSCNTTLTNADKFIVFDEILLCQFCQ